MKTLKLIAILLLYALYGQGQITACRTDSVPPPPFPSCTGCGDLSNYVPGSTDSVIYVKVNFFFAKPNSGTGMFKPYSTTLTDCQAICTAVNALYSSLSMPRLRVHPTPPFVADTRIRFIVNDHQIFTDSVNYWGLNEPKVVGEHVLLPPPATFTSVGKAISIVFGCDTNTYQGRDTVNHVWKRYPLAGYGITSGVPGSYINIRHTADTGWVWYEDVEIIEHELGHALGLYHTNEIHACLDDYLIEDSLIWNKSDNNCVSSDTAYSNNIMAYDWGCRKYFSPKQIGRMHYFFNDGETIPYTTLAGYDTSKTVRITSSQTWTTARYIKGNLIIKPGNTLTVKCKVAMNSSASVIVEKGAALVIDGGEITQVGKHSWQGIQVAGTTTLAQSYNSTTGLSPNQGVLRIINGGTVSHAANGVRNYTLYPNGALDWNSMGGLIFANGANFLNNARAVEFQSYPLFPTTSYFNACNFIVNDSVGGGQLPLKWVTMYDVSGVKFGGCNFTFNDSTIYSLSFNPGIGIYTQDASYSVDKSCNIFGTCTGTSSFNNLTTGIYVLNANPLNVVNVSNTTFSQSTTYATNFHNMNSFLFNGNTITNHQIFPDGGNGLYLNNCENYTIKNNVFSENGNYYHLTTGIYAVNSGSGAHQIYRNNFSKMCTGICCIGNNNGGSSTTGLLMNCNTFTASTGTGNNNFFDIGLMSYLYNQPGFAIFLAPTVKATQGSYNLSSPDPKTLVRNQYGATCGGSNKWYIDSYGTQVILHTNNNAPAATSPTPHTAGSACSPTLVNVQTASVALNYSSDCLSLNPTDVVPYNHTLTLSNTNGFIQAARAAGSTDQFGLQAAMATKLNLFIADSAAANPDSVISTLDYNVGSMDDADILTVFAYMKKHDYTTATTKANALGSGRSDWKALLLELITINQDSNKIYSIKTNASYKSFLVGYATTDGKDGQIVAQSLLSFVCDTIFEIQLQTPCSAPGSSRELPPENKSVSSSNVISIYPNPTENGVTVDCKGYGGSSLLLEVRDLLGRIILTKFISGLDQEYISLSEFKNGVYFFSVSKNKEIVYSTKIVKQD